MLYGTEIAVCFQINTKHINAVWAEALKCQVLIARRDVALPPLRMGCCAALWVFSC
jgi:hypothetical protein